MELPPFRPDLHEAAPRTLTAREKFLNEGGKRATTAMRKAFLPDMLSVIDHAKVPPHAELSADVPASHVRHGHGSAVGPDAIQHHLAKYNRHV